MTPPRPIIIQPDTGKDLYAFGEILSVLLSGEETSGLFTVMFDLIPLGGESPLLVPSEEDELFLVVDGRISYFIEGHWTEVEAGGLVYLPRGNIRAYRNVGITPSHQWIVSTPAGLKTFFERCADEFARLGGPNLKQIVDIGHEHGLELLNGFPLKKERNHGN